MAVQVRLDNTTCDLILSGNSFARNGNIAQNAQRTTPLLHGTVLAEVVATPGVYTPFVALNLGTGASVPSAIYLGDDIPAADLVAGVIEDVPILQGGNCTVDESLVIFDDGTLDADSIIPAAAANPYFVINARKCLALFGMFLELTVAISEHEN